MLSLSKLFRKPSIILVGGFCGNSGLQLKVFIRRYIMVQSMFGGETSYKIQSLKDIQDDIDRWIQYTCLLYTSPSPRDA